MRQKVRLLSIMAGAFTKDPRSSDGPYDHKEYNIVKDIPAAKKIATTGPRRSSGAAYEIGIAVPYPHQSIEEDFGMSNTIHWPKPTSLTIRRPTIDRRGI